MSSSFTSLKTPQQPLNLMKFSPKSISENSSSSKSFVDLSFNSKNDTTMKPDGETLISLIRQCYLPSDFSSINISTNDNSKNDFFSPKTNIEENDCFNKMNNQNNLVETNPNYSNPYYNSNTNFISKLAKETSSSFANFSIETILASRRKRLTELAHLTDPTTNNHLNEQLQNYHQNYQKQQSNFMQQQQFILNNSNPTNSVQHHSMFDLQSQLFSLAAAAAAANNFSTNLDNKRQNSSNPAQLALPSTSNQLIKLKDQSLSNGLSCMTNETQLNTDNNGKYSEDNIGPIQLISSNGGQLSKIKISRKKCFNRGPRIPFSGEQICILERKFKDSHYLSSFEVVNLSEQLNLTEARVKIWFQNRRARLKREQKSK